jgi:hypothetical protein
MFEEISEKALPVFNFLTFDTSVPVFILYGPSGSGKKRVLDLVKIWMERLIESGEDPIPSQVTRIPRAYSIIIQYQQRTEHFSHPILIIPDETLNRDCKTILVMQNKPSQDLCCALRAVTHELAV